MNTLTPSLPQAVKFPGGKVLTYTPADSIFDGSYNKSTFSPFFSSFFSLEFLSRTQAKGKKGLNDFKSSTFIGRFQSDGAVSMAVKGLRRNPYLPADRSMTSLFKTKLGGHEK